MRAILLTTLLVGTSSLMGCSDPVNIDLGELYADDKDRDGVPDDIDNCPDIANGVQIDSDLDGVGDACDADVRLDSDGDGVWDDIDNCVSRSNPDQEDADLDGIGNICDNCPNDNNVDQADADNNGVGDVCACDDCGLGEYCVTHPGELEACVDTCSEVATCGTECCPLGGTCDSELGRCLLPDLWVDAATTSQGVTVELVDFAETSCELARGCVQEAGPRRILRFPLRAANSGAGPAYLGDPASEPGFEIDECTDANSFSSFARYELQSADGTAVVPGHTQTYCVSDNSAFESGVAPAVFNCAFQGISAGWTSVIPSTASCQFIDVTDVAPGEYNLLIELNPANVLAEQNTANNTAVVPVVVPADLDTAVAP